MSSDDTRDRMDPRQWIRTLATALDVEPPTDEEVEHLLSLAGTAAHTAERWTAPVSTWLVARAGVEPAEGRAAVERLSATALDGEPATRD